MSQSGEKGKVSNRPKCLAHSTALVSSIQEGFLVINTLTSPNLMHAHSQASREDVLYTCVRLYCLLSRLHDGNHH